jgi:hypothetical protein
MAFPSTYSAGQLGVLDIQYPFYSTWLDIRTNQRSDTQFNYDEYKKYVEAAPRIYRHKRMRWQTGMRFDYIPVEILSSTFTVSSPAKEDGVYVNRTRIGLQIRFFDTATLQGDGDVFVFIAPTAALMGSLIKICDIVALSKVLSISSNYQRVYNDTGSTLTAGTAVAYNGITSDGVPEVEPTDANNSDNNIVGILQEDIGISVTGACTWVKNNAVFIPNNKLTSPNDGAQVFISSDTGALSHTPGAGNQAIGTLLHEGTGGGAHIIGYSLDF